MIGEIRLHGVEHPLSVACGGDDTWVYAPQGGIRIRVVTIPAVGDARWDGGWFSGEPEVQAAIVRAALALRDRVTRTCDQ